MKCAIIVHGGAEKIPPEKEEAMRAGVVRALEEGWRVLEDGGSAVDAVEAAVRALEDRPSFNAGYGSAPNSEGVVQMDAAIMEGSTLKAGAVGAIEGVRHPVSVARLLLEEQPVLLVADGARRFAAEHGAELCSPEEMLSPEQRQAWQLHEATGHDTVGCVALDAQGRLAAATSTGGAGENPPGRVGDSPLPGCGLYADDRLGAVAATGDGEEIMRVVLAKTALELLPDHGPDEAARRALRALERVGGEAGLILLDREGRVGWDHHGPNMACAYRGAGMSDVRVFLAKNEEEALHDQA